MNFFRKYFIYYRVNKITSRELKLIKQLDNLVNEVDMHWIKLRQQNDLSKVDWWSKELDYNGKELSDVRQKINLLKSKKKDLYRKLIKDKNEKKV